MSNIKKSLVVTDNHYTVTELNNDQKSGIAVHVNDMINNEQALFKVNPRSTLFVIDSPVLVGDILERTDSGWINTGFNGARLR